MKIAYARVVLLLIGMALSIPAYSQSGVIAGTVLDRDGKPIEGATITIDRKEVGLHVETKTDRRGIYIRTGFDDGVYRVSVIQGGVPVAAADAVISLGFRVERDFDLRTFDKQQQQQAPTVSLGAALSSKAQRDAETKANNETQGAFNAGLNALKAGNLDEAAKQFNLAAEKRPAMPVIFNRLGETYTAAKKYSEAADAYKKATELKGDEPDYFNSLGLAAANAGKFDVAKAAIQKAVELDPSRGGAAFFNLGMLLDRAGQDKDAIEAMQRSIKQNPKTADTYYQLGLLLMKNAATIPDSAAQFEKYLQLEPKGANAATAKELAAAAKASAPAK